MIIFLHNLTDTTFFGIGREETFAAWHRLRLWGCATGTLAATALIGEARPWAVSIPTFVRQGRGGRGRLKVLARKTAISARVTLFSGQ